ncbi:MAG: transporter [Oscillospiraceae bacterium]|jgi:ABC-type polysaccharide/polyol phosphate transport system ATPase subunit|nr:transporter [Oscillospiraceae bacterium]
MNQETIIAVSHLSKAYRLYQKKSDRVREAISLRGKKYYQPFYALHDISFTVRRGETLGIIGTNGSGKSTLLKILSGVVTPTDGTVKVDGRISALLELGAGFNPEYTGLENIALHGTMMGYTEQEMAVKREEIIRFADIGAYINQPVKNYSSGMFARLAFAVAINVEPEILIVDEALSVGDAFFQNKCYRKLEQLRSRGITVLFVSHDTAAVKQLCSRVLWIERGEQRALGDAAEVCAMYFNEQIRQRNRVEAEGLTCVSAETSLALEAPPNARLVIPTVKAGPSDILSPQVKILSAFFQDETGAVVTELESDQRYTFHVVADFLQSMEHVIGGVVLENLKGVQLLAMNSYIGNDEQTFTVEKPGVLDIAFSLKLPKIRTGDYLFSPAIAQGIQQQHVIASWLQSCGSVRITTSGYNLSLIEIESQVHIVKYRREQVELA